jgi:hypothetical protein
MTEKGRRREGNFTPNPGEEEGEGFVRYVRQKVGDEKLFEMVKNGSRKSFIALIRESLTELDFSSANAERVAEEFGKKIEILDLEMQSKISMGRHMNTIARSIQRTLQGVINR